METYTKEGMCELRWRTILVSASAPPNAAFCLQKERPRRLRPVGTFSCPRGLVRPSSAPPRRLPALTSISARLKWDWQSGFNVLRQRARHL
jgi:hypothetical protein